MDPPNEQKMKKNSADTRLLPGNIHSPLFQEDSTEFNNRSLPSSSSSSEEPQAIDRSFSSSEGDAVEFARSVEHPRPVLEESTVEIFLADEEHPEDPLPSEFVTDFDIRTRSCWDNYLAQSLASDEMEALQATEECRLTKTDSHSSGRSSSLSSAGSDPRPEAAMEEGPKDPDFDMDLDIDPGEASGFQPGFIEVDEELTSEMNGDQESLPSIYVDDEGVYLMCQDNNSTNTVLETLSEEESRASISPLPSTSSAAPVATTCTLKCDACSRPKELCEGRFGLLSLKRSNLSLCRQHDSQLNIGGPFGLKLAHDILGVVDEEFSPPASKEESFQIASDCEILSQAPKQKAASSCGSVAAASVLQLLRESYENSPDTIIPVRLRANEGFLDEYIVSRSKAGTTHEDLAAGVEKLSGGRIRCRFFSTFPKRDTYYTAFLHKWLTKGAVPILTMNLQRSVLIPPKPKFQYPSEELIPDAWHHQAVYGANPLTATVKLVNPIEEVSENHLKRVLDSDRVLLIRANDVLLRWREDGTRNLDQIMAESILDPRWTEFNVPGQIVALIREATVAQHPPNIGFCMRRTTHIAIPASYNAGISLFAPSDSTVWEEVCAEPELPILNDSETVIDIDNLL